MGSLSYNRSNGDLLEFYKSYPLLENSVYILSHSIPCIYSPLSQIKLHTFSVNINQIHCFEWSTQYSKLLKQTSRNSNMACHQGNMYMYCYTCVGPWEGLDSGFR